MNPDTTPTPRTDYQPNFSNGLGIPAVATSFARQLQRELTEKTNEVADPSNKSMLTSQSDSVELYHALCDATVNFSKALDACKEYRKELDEKTNEVARLREENAELKQGKVFVDPKWIYNLETQLAKAHEELCKAGLREYGN